MELQFHPEIASSSFGRRMAFPNFVYLGATTGGDSNGSYKLQEPARMPSKGTCPDPTSCTKGFGSETHSFSLTLSVCVDRNVTLRYHSTLTLCYCPTRLPRQRVPQGPKGVWRLRPVEEQCRSRCPPIPSRAGWPSSMLGSHSTDCQLASVTSTNRSALGSSIVAAETTKHVLSVPSWTPALNLSHCVLPLAWAAHRHQFLLARCPRVTALAACTGFISVPLFPAWYHVNG